MPGGSQPKGRTRGSTGRPNGGTKRPSWEHSLHGKLFWVALAHLSFMLYGNVSAGSCGAWLRSSLWGWGARGHAGLDAPHPAAPCVRSARACADPPLRATGFRKLLVSSAHSHMGRSQNHLFFAWRLLSSHRRPSLAFFHCERGMGTGPAFPPLPQRGRQQVSSWHLSSCLEEAPVANLLQPQGLGVPGFHRGWVTLVL